MHLFHHSKFLQQSGSIQGSIISSVEPIDYPILPLTPAQQCAAAVLLFQASALFKRLPAAWFSESIINVDFDRALLRGGGYALRSAGEMKTLFANKFVHYLQRRTVSEGLNADEQKIVMDGPSSFDSIIEASDSEKLYLNTLRAMDIFSTMPMSAKPAPLLRHILRLLGLQQNPVGAASVMKLAACSKIIQSTTLKAATRADKPTSANNFGQSHGLWSPQMASSTHKLIEAVTERRTAIASSSNQNQGTNNE